MYNSYSFFMEEMGASKDYIHNCRCGYPLEPDDTWDIYADPEPAPIEQAKAKVEAGIREWLDAYFDDNNSYVVRIEPFMAYPTGPDSVRVQVIPVIDIAAEDETSGSIIWDDDLADINEAFARFQSMNSKWLHEDWYHPEDIGVSMYCFNLSDGIIRCMERYVEKNNLRQDVPAFGIQTNEFILIDILDINEMKYVVEGKLRGLMPCIVEFIKPDCVFRFVPYKAHDVCDNVIEVEYELFLDCAEDGEMPGSIIWDDDLTEARKRYDGRYAENKTGYHR